MSVPWVTDGHIVELTVTPVSQEDIVEVHRRIDDPEMIRRFEKMVEDLRPRWRSLGGVVIGLRITHKFSVTWDGGQQCDYRIGGNRMLSLNHTLSLNEDQYKFVDKLCQDMDKIGS